ncbi:tetratricopeptide repeat-containing sulfotransferase family protein [Thalassomonas sp. M1454]|uniref:tetratricopeptide repeat-containing sulfotransferase family protein n=1 Tax=Thalassomonas sp. M1454 TaxID=2594477 RepID=UPI001181152A|nr:sulfotransferase [Thalassomonas sp. M1454]TRX57235.1 tetratricopeptide repeat protein [Thalassomonas sp. M1454]
MKDKIQQQIQTAQREHQQGNLVKANELFKLAEETLNSASEPSVNLQQRLHIVSALSQINLQMQQYKPALSYLSLLMTLQPTNSQLLQQIIQVASHLKDWPLLCENYLKFIDAHIEAKQSIASDHYFNLGYYYKQAGNYVDAIAQFELAIRHNINQAEEVYLNLAVIYSEKLRQEEQAKQALHKALQLNSRFTPALYNLATLYEEEGNKTKAMELYRQTLQYEPHNYNALARIADLYNFTDVNDPVFKQILSALSHANLALEDKINLNYALGKAFDDCQDYKQASYYYAKANEHNTSLLAPYQPQALEAHINENISLFSKQWFEQLEPISTAEPIFICGMFRSGSTLVEQILASHSKITAGGEITYFPDLVNTKLLHYPSQCSDIEIARFKQYAQDYLTLLSTTFPGYDLVTDKRPDNFLYLGLIKTLFPNAKIIHTQRQEMDNCLSVYFLRLADSLNYATKLSNIMHYYQQQQRLVNHFKSLFPDTIYSIDYDNLVVNPEQNIQSLLSFIGLGWEDGCMNFNHLNNKVKTASVWKVRQPIFQKSSGRWLNYKNYLK